MGFRNWFENGLRTGAWQQFEGIGYSVQITQYSNKGPMFIINDPKGQEISRAFFDMFKMSWKTD